MLMPEYLKIALDAEIAKHGKLTDEQRKAVSAEAYGQAQDYINTHEPGPYPSWGEGHEYILAGNVVRDAVRSVLHGR